MKIPPKWLIGNWKMHKTRAEAIQFVKEILPKATHSLDEIGLAVPFTCIAELAKESLQSPLEIGCQNIYSKDQGAFTGEISAEMALEAGASFTLVGHSERRALFNETNEFINSKVLHAVSKKLKVVLCIGETELERSSGRAYEVLSKQISEGLKKVSSKEMEKVSIAYEPVWAIGSGVAASPEVAEECHRFCRSVIEELYSHDVGQRVKILYGGSVQPENINKFLEKVEINGVLIGKASLSSPAFAKIIDFRNPESHGNKAT